MQKALIDTYRHFLKDSIRKTVDFSQTDQNRGISPPPLEKPFNTNAQLGSIAPLIFTALTWNIPQTVTVSAVDDNVDETSPHTGTIAHIAASSDPNYDGKLRKIKVKMNKPGLVARTKVGYYAKKRNEKKDDAP